MVWFRSLFSEEKGFAPVLAESKKRIFDIFDLEQPNDAQEMKASFYLCIAAIAILRSSNTGGAYINDVIDDLVADTRAQVKPLMVYAEDLSNSPDQLNRILTELPDGAIGATRLNGLAAFEVMYFSIGLELVEDILNHSQGPLGTPGYAGVVVADGIFGEGGSRDKFMEVSAQMLSFTQGLTNVV